MKGSDWLTTLYSNGCPKCKVLTKKLTEKGIGYEIITDVSIMLNKGIKLVPYLEVDGVLMNFEEAIKWVNEQ